MSEMRRLVRIVEGLSETVRKPLGRITSVDRGGYDIVGGRSKWVNAFHGTAGSDTHELHPHGGFVWATLSPEHASSYATSDRAYWKGGDNPAVFMFRINIAGFLIIDGNGQEIREVDGEDWHTGWTPYDVAQQLKLPGVLFKKVRDNVDEDNFNRSVNLVAVSDTSRIRPLFEETEKLPSKPPTPVDPADDFIDAYLDALKASPVGDICHVSPWNRGKMVVEILHIGVELDKRGQGAGNQAMEILTRMADQFGITLELGVADDADPETGLGWDDLHDWYERWGFEGGSHMKRCPENP